MDKYEQVKPIAPFSCQLRSNHGDEAIDLSNKKLMLQRRRCLQCCGCITALLLVLIVIIIVIATVYHVNNPSMKMNSVTIIQRLELLKNGSVLVGGGRGGDENVTLLVDVSVKNPNHNSFKFSNATATVYYGGVVVGEGHIPPGIAKARRTLRMNVTVDLIPVKIMTVTSLRSDILSGTLNMSSFTRFAGKVKILNVVKKSVVVKMNCSISYTISSRAFQEKCTKSIM